MVHQGSDETRGRWAVIVFLVDKMPKGFEDIAGGLLVFYAGRHLEVSHLAIKSRWECTSGKRHGEVGEESDANQFKVLGKTDRIDYGARTEIDKCASKELTTHEIEVDLAFAAGDNTQSMVIDDKGWLLLHDESDHLRVAMDHRQFVAEEDALTYLREVIHKDVAHSRHI